MHLCKTALTCVLIASCSSFTSEGPANAFSHLSTIAITNFEVVQSTGPLEGPRSPGAPVANAGPDKNAGINTSISLSGGVLTSNGTGPITTEWKLLSGPGSVQFANISTTSTSASFVAPGDYTLLLKAEDGIHTPSFDTVIVRVSSALAISISREQTGLRLTWSGGAGSYTVETTENIGADWAKLQTVAVPEYSIDPGEESRFFRVRQN